MKESDIRAEVYNLMERSWYWPSSGRDTWICRACGELNHPRGGKPDIICRNPNGPGVPVEVKRFPKPSKTGATSFAFSKIEPPQRLWLSNWDSDCKPGSPGAYLALGTVHGRAGSIKSPRYLWMPPWQVWLRVEERLRALRVSLPLLADKARPKEVRENWLDAVTMLQFWALDWRDGRWHFQPSHPLWVGQERDLKEFRAMWKTDV